MKKKLIIAIVAVLIVAGIGVGAFFIIKHIVDENHKKDIEMAADCAKTFEVSSYSSSSSSSWGEAMREIQQHNAEVANNRRNKRQECAEKYHVTHQEIIDKIGTDDYNPE